MSVIENVVRDTIVVVLVALLNAHSNIASIVR